MELPLQGFANDIADELLDEWGIECDLNTVNIFDKEKLLKKLKEHLDD